MPNREHPGSQLSDDEWNDIYADVAAHEADQRKQQWRDIIAIIETLEVIGYLTLREDDNVEMMAEEVLLTLEGEARDAARMEQTWTDHRGQP